VVGLLEAIEELVRQGRFDGTVLLVGGAGWGASGVEERLARPVLAERVVLAGFVEAEELPGLYRGARLFVLPSLYEGFGLPVLEAMASGTPVVCSDRDPFSEIADGAAVLADLERDGGLAEAIGRAWSDPELRARLRREGLQRAGAFGWRRAAEHLREVMAGLLPERSPQ
jgi:alpha-1,3-rhamnosyl/mannosyltransferase